MWKKTPAILALTALATLSAGLTCTIRPGNGSGDPIPGVTPLDQTDTAITVAEDVGDNQAAVIARVAGTFGINYELTDDQAIIVNGTTLTGPDAGDAYRATIPTAAAYAVQAVEPTRGVETTTITAPLDFELTDPAGQASLAGFTLSWSNPEADLQIRITLAQTLFGEQRTETFGPFTDDGSLTLTNQDLVDFQQGASIQVTMRKVRTLDSVNGFASGTLSAAKTATGSLTPGP